MTSLLMIEQIPQLGGETGTIIAFPDETFGLMHLRGRQYLNPYAFEDLHGDAACLKAMADEAWKEAGAGL